MGIPTNYTHPKERLTP